MTNTYTMLPPMPMLVQRDGIWRYLSPKCDALFETISVVDQYYILNDKMFTADGQECLGFRNSIIFINESIRIRLYGK